MIYVFLADGFEEIEAITVIDIIRRADLLVKTVGIGAKEVAGAHGIRVLADIDESELVFENLGAIVLPGGMPGTKNLERSNSVINCINYCVSNKKYIAAICAAPSILGHMGVLRDKTVCCFPGFESELAGANISYLPVFTCENIITARGAGNAVEFALKIVEVLADKKSSDEIRYSIQCDI